MVDRQAKNPGSVQAEKHRKKGRNRYGRLIKQTKVRINQDA